MSLTKHSSVADETFHYLDNDDSGGLNYQEICHVLKFMNLRNEISSEVIPGIHFTYNDFEALTEQGNLLGPQKGVLRDKVPLSDIPSLNPGCVLDGIG